MNFTMNLRRLTCLCFLFSLIASCNNEEIGKSGDVNPEAIYFDYHFSAAEEGGDITLKLQYRYGGKEGTTLVLDEPGNVTVDGVRLPVDSSGIDGAFYEVVRPFNEFTGPHRIVYTSSEGKKYEETIEFPAFQLEGVLPDTIGKGQLALDIAGLKRNDLIQVMLTDTARFSKGIERFDSLEHGRLVLDSGILSALKPGPVNFQLVCHRNLPLQQTTPEGGMLTVSYSVSREIFLR
ncbi:MAG: hypothetical protein ABWZ25_10665 [Chitinophagaceae bacterium]